MRGPPNRPIVGDKLYEVESGIIAGWVRLTCKEHPLESVPFAPSLVGQKPVSIVLGKNSGPPSMDEWCEKLGVKPTDEEKMAMLLQVKAKSEFFSRKARVSRASSDIADVGREPTAHPAAGSSATS